MTNAGYGKTWDFSNYFNDWALNESGVATRIYLYAGGGVNLSGNVNGGAFFESSDIRYKNVIETNPNIDLTGIDVIKFTRTDDDNEQIRYGYSAQQVQSVLSDVVTLDPKDDKLTVNYSDIHTLKIAALEKRIEELELRLKSTL